MLIQTERMDRALESQTNFYDQGTLTALGGFLSRSANDLDSNHWCYHLTLQNDHTQIVALLTFDRDHEALPEVLNLLASKIADFYHTLPSAPQGPSAAHFDVGSTWIKRDYLLELDQNVLGTQHFNLTLWVGVRLQEVSGHA